MGIAWSNRLAVGVESIDTQHQELFDRINGLLDAMTARNGSTEVPLVLKFLGDYVKFHFDDEERLMFQHRYPEFEDHRRLHAAFVNDLKKISAELTRSGATSAVATQLSNRACSWLLDHIGGADTKLGAYLQARTRAAARP